MLFVIDNLSDVRAAMSYFMSLGGHSSCCGMISFEIKLLLRIPVLWKVATSKLAWNSSR